MASTRSVARHQALYRASEAVSPFLPLATPNQWPCCSVIVRSDVAARIWLRTVPDLIRTVPIGVSRNLSRLKS